MSGGATIVGCGNVEEAATLGIDIVIVDPDTHELRPDGTVGEIWVRWVFVSAPSRFQIVALMRVCCLVHVKGVPRALSATTGERSRALTVSAQDSRGRRPTRGRPPTSTKVNKTG